MYILALACSASPYPSVSRGVSGGGSVAGLPLVGGVAGGGGEVPPGGDTGDLSPSCGDPWEPPDLSSGALSGDELLGTAEVSLCVGSSEVGGWFTMAWWAPDGGVLCHQGREAVSSEPVEPPYGLQEAFLISFGEPVVLDGDCGDVPLEGEWEREWAFSLPGRVEWLDPNRGWTQVVDSYSGTTSYEETSAGWSVVLEFSLSPYVLP